MSDRIEAAIAALRGRDATAYRKARCAAHRAGVAYDAEAAALGVAGQAAYERLERYMARALKPHGIEWRTYGRTTSNDVNHDDWTVRLHLSGEVWPHPKGGRYRMQMRAHIPFSMSPRDADEFLRGVALLKAAADAVSDGGL